MACYRGHVQLTALYSAYVHNVVHMYTSSAHVHNVHKVVHTTQCSAIYVKIITRADYS